MKSGCTSNGHNAPLNRSEFEVLNEFIRNRLGLQGECEQGRLSEEEEII